MGFLIRMGFWSGLVLLALPIGGAGTDGPSVNPIDALSAAGAAVGDIAGLCDRKPEVCDTGRAAFHVIGERARDGAGIAYRMLEQEEARVDPESETGSIVARPPAAVGEGHNPVPTQITVFPSARPEH